MRKLNLIAAVALLLLGSIACSRTEETNTTSSETSSTAVTTTTAGVTTDTTMSTAAPAETGTIVETGSTGSAMSTATTAPAATSTTTTRVSTTTKGPATRGPIVTDTVAPNARSTPPPIGKTTTQPSSAPPSSTTTSTTTTPPATATQAPSSTASPASSGALVAEGQATFRSGCTPCHGSDGSGNTAMGKKNNIPDFRSATVQGRSDAELVGIIQNGLGPVSAGAHKAKHLSTDQAKAVVAYIRSLK